MEQAQWLAVAVAAAVVAGVVTQPRRLGAGGVALLGSGAMLALGLVSPGEALAALRRDLGVLVFFIGLMLLAHGAEAAGVFTWLARWAVRQARGSPRRLMVNVILAGTVVTGLFSNDAAVLLLTPSVLSAVAQEEHDPLPYLFACGFIADFASVLLPVSNPVNLLVAERLQIDLGDYLLRLTLPGLVAVAATLLLFLWLFRGELRRAPAIVVARIEEPSPLRLFAVLVLAALGLAYVLFALRGWPIGPVTLVAGLLLSGVTARRLRRPWRSVAASVSWQAIAMIGGLLLVMDGLRTTGVTAEIAPLLERLGAGGPVAALLATTGVVALAASAMNNWPAAVLAVSALSTAGAGSVTQPAAYGVILGADLGSKLTVVGSLATVLWLALLRQRGVLVDMGRYARTALLTTPLVLGAAAGAAALSLVWVR